MDLTRDNYYTREANEAYWSASFVKEMLDCPARALAELREEWERPSSTALLVGSYVDAHFEGRLPEFVAAHPEIINSRTGALKADYLATDKMIARAEADPVFMDYMTGDKQVIKTGAIGGIPFKCKMDVYMAGVRIVDLKTVKDFEPLYRPGEGRLHYADFWRWPLQMAIYQAIEGNRLPCYLAVISKQDPPDIDLIEIPQDVLDMEIKLLKDKLPYFDAMRSGVIEPERCGKCAYCRQTHKLTGPTIFNVMEE